MTTMSKAPTVGADLVFDAYVQKTWPDRIRVLERVFGRQWVPPWTDDVEERNWWRARISEFREEAWGSFVRQQTDPGTRALLAECRTIAAESRARLRELQAERERKGRLEAEQQADEERRLRLEAEQRAEEAEQKAALLEGQRESWENVLWCVKCQAPARELECRQCGHRVR
jgi:hypothetical protein